MSILSRIAALAAGLRDRLHGPVPHPTCSADMREAVLESLAANYRCGRDIRNILATKGHRMTRPAFYWRMAALEEAGDVVGWYEGDQYGGIQVKERWYRLADRPGEEE